MKTRRIWILFSLVCAVFGTTFLAIRMGLDAGASPLLFAGLRFVAAGIILSGFLAASGRLTPARAIAYLPRAAFLSLFLTVGTFGFMFVAETRISSGLMARLDATGPLFTALFAAIFLGRKFAPLHAAAFALGTAGAVLIADPSATGDPVFLAAAMASVLFYAAGNALYPRIFPGDADPLSASALQTLVGGALLLALAFVFEKPVFPRAAVGPLLYLTLAGSVFAHTATLVLVRDAGPVFASSWLYAAPAAATIAGILVLGEAVSAAGSAGTVLALGGVFLLGRAESSLRRSALRRSGSAAQAPSEGVSAEGGA